MNIPYLRQKQNDVVGEINLLIFCIETTYE